MFAPLVEKLRRVIQSWATRELSYAGMLQLVKTVLGGIVSFWNQMFLLLEGVIKQVEGICRNFLWSGKDTGRKNLVAWEVVTLPLEEGGLGVKEVLSWNKSIFIKLAADIVLGKQNVWTLWVHCNLLRGRDIWDVQPKQTDTWTWKRLLKVLHEFKDLISLQPGIHFSQPNGVDFNQFCHVNGTVSSSMVYEVLRTKRNTTVWGKYIWKGIQCRRWVFIMWIALHGRLYTRKRMQDRGLLDSAECALCDTGEETESHLWFECVYVKEVMDIIFKWVDISSRERSLGGWMEWFGGDNATRSLKFQCKLLVFVAIVYFTWKSRNRVVHGAGKWSPSECALEIRRKCSDRMLAKCKFTSTVDRAWRDFLGV